LRPSVFVDAGAVFGVRNPTIANGGLVGINPSITCSPTTTNTTGGIIPTPDTADDIVRPGGVACANSSNIVVGQTNGLVEEFFGDTWKPRVSIGIGVNWNSPFGPFRIDIARALLKEPGDDTKLFTFNVGTQF
jgi:outer membrane protein insertion porin family